jgi:hypothetical protein
MKKSRKLECHVANSNIAIDTFGRSNSVFEKIMMERLEPIFIVISNFGEDVQYSWKQLLISNGRNGVHWVVLGLSQYWACTDLFENFSENSLKGDLSNDTALTPPLFSLANTFKLHNQLLFISDGLDIRF